MLGDDALFIPSTSLSRSILTAPPSVARSLEHTERFRWRSPRLRSPPRARQRARFSPAPHTIAAMSANACMAPAAANLGAAVTSRRQGSALLTRATAPKQGAITVRVRSSRRSRASHRARPSRWDASPRDPPRPSRAKPSRSPSRSPVDEFPSPPVQPRSFSAAARASSSASTGLSIPAPSNTAEGIDWDKMGSGLTETAT